MLLLSARNALMSRLVLTNRADSSTLARFARIAFGSFAGRGRSALKAADESYRNAAKDMLEASGVLELEERVLTFLYANR